MYVGSLLFEHELHELNEFMEINKIYNESNLETIAKMPDNFIDLVVTSPPYDGLRQYNGYCFDFENLAKGLYRVMKPGGTIVWIVNDATIDGSETGTSFRQALYFKEVGFNLLDTMIWCKDGGGALGSNYCYAQNIEYMFIITKGTPKAVNLIKDKKNQSFGTAAHVQNGRRNADGTIKVEKRKAPSEFSRRNNWWLVVPGAEEGSSFHPAVFPEKLVRDHIWTWSNEGDLVYDPFMGSGTTAKCAHNLKRNYIGSEISSEYVEKARKRVWAEEAQLTLF